MHWQVCHSTITTIFATATATQKRKTRTQLHHLTHTQPNYRCVLRGYLRPEESREVQPSITERACVSHEFKLIALNNLRKKGTSTKFVIVASSSITFENMMLFSSLRFLIVGGNQLLVVAFGYMSLVLC